jgi:hypothetical protein
MVDSSPAQPPPEHIYTFQVVKFEIVNNDYVDYLIKVLVNPWNISFHIKDRYSGLFEF